MKKSVYQIITPDKRIFYSLRPTSRQLCATHTPIFRRSHIIRPTPFHPSPPPICLLHSRRKSPHIVPPRFVGNTLIANSSLLARPGQHRNTLLPTLPYFSSKLAAPPHPPPTLRHTHSNFPPLPHHSPYSSPPLTTAVHFSPLHSVALPAQWFIFAHHLYGNIIQKLIY